MTTTTKYIGNFSQLVEELTANNVPMSVDADRQTILMKTAADALGNRLIIRWEKLYPFVQVIQPMIDGVPEGRIADVEAAIGRLNNSSMYAGLGFDYASNLVYYRVTLSVLVDGVRAELLQAFLHGAVRNATEMLSALQRVVAGAPGRDVLALVKPDAQS